MFSFVPGDLLVEHRKCICANLGVIWYYPNCISKYHKTTKPDEQHRPICNYRAAIQNRRTRVLLTVDITSETFYSVSYMQYSAGDSHCPISESIVRFPYGSHNIIFRACLKTIYGCYCYARLFFSESLFMPCVCVCVCVFVCVRVCVSVVVVVLWWVQQCIPNWGDILFIFYSISNLFIQGKQFSQSIRPWYHVTK